MRISMQIRSHHIHAYTCIHIHVYSQEPGPAPPRAPMPQKSDRYLDAKAFLAKLGFDNAAVDALLVGGVETSTDDGLPVPALVKKQWQHWNVAGGHPDKGGNQEAYNEMKEQYTAFKVNFDAWLQAHPTGQQDFQTWCRESMPASRDPKPRTLELVSLQTFLCQACAALRVLRQGGTFICKVTDSLGRCSVGTYYLLCQCFGFVTIVKPSTSSPAKCERFLIALNFLGNDNELVIKVRNHLAEALRTAATAQDGDLSVVEIVPTPMILKEPFFNRLNKLNERFFYMFVASCIIAAVLGSIRNQDWNVLFSLDPLSVFFSRHAKSEIAAVQDLLSCADRGSFAPSVDSDLELSRMGLKEIAGSDVPHVCLG